MLHKLIFKRICTGTGFSQILPSAAVLGNYFRSTANERPSRAHLEQKTATWRSDRPSIRTKNRHRTNKGSTEREDKDDVIVKAVEKNIAQKDYAKES